MEILWINLYQYHSVRQKSHMDRTEIESEVPRNIAQEPNNYSSALFGSDLF
jgi:hypothetical protein